MKSCVNCWLRCVNFVVIKMECQFVISNSGEFKITNSNNYGKIFMYENQEWKMMWQFLVGKFWWTWSATWLKIWNVTWGFERGLKFWARPIFGQAVFSVHLSGAEGAASEPPQARKPTPARQQSLDLRASSRSERVTPGEETNPSQVDNT